MNPPCLRRLTHYKKCLLITTAITSTTFLLLGNFLSSELNSFNEVQKCPACYGVSLCEEFYNGRVEIPKWQKLGIVNYFNTKNVYWGIYKNQSIILKKLAHNSELSKFDEGLCKEIHQENGCDLKEGMMKVLEKKKKRVNGVETTDLMSCFSSRLLDRVWKKFSEKKFQNEDAEFYMWTLLFINPEPLILQTFRSEDGWPFPRYFGACGRVIMEEYIGLPLSAFQNAPLKMRLNLALQITKIAQKLTSTPWGFHLYMTDVSFENFAVTPEGRVVLVDCENIIVVDYKQINNSEVHQHTQFTNGGNHLIFSPQDLCTHSVADHNYYVVCQGLLSDSPWSHGIEGGLLYDLPQWLDQLYRVKKLIENCAEKKVVIQSRFTVIPLLQKALKKSIAAL